MALIAPVILAAGVYIVLDRSGIVIAPRVMPPETAQRSTKAIADQSYIIPTPMPKVPARVPSQVVPARAVGPGVFKCEETSGAVSYSAYPCGNGKVIDIKPTSGGFAENWSITVKGR